ncbi:MAG: hypothetical protein LBU14_02010 [Candidatus Peribacteria bacterium]|nr:hypothetical protein [Candidatus Peribacteria bacterium]
MISQIFSSFSKLTSIKSTKSVGKSFTSISFICSSIIAHSTVDFDEPIKDRGIFVVIFSHLVIA